MCEMTIETVKSTIKGHLGELLNLDPAQIGDNDLLIDDLGRTASSSSSCT